MCVVTDFLHHVLAVIHTWLAHVHWKLRHLAHHVKHEFQHLTGIHGCPIRWMAEKVKQEPELRVGLGLAGNVLITVAIVGLGFVDWKLGEMNQPLIEALFY